jgi:methionyl aminopeptidase
MEKSGESTTHVPEEEPDRSRQELIAGYRTLAGTLDAILCRLETCVRPGVTTRELEVRAVRLMGQHGVRSYFKGYRGYPASITTSVNDEVINTLPSDKVLKPADLLSMQVGITDGKAFSYQGWTYALGHVMPHERKLLEAARRALRKACALCTADHSVPEISRAIQAAVVSAGFSVNRDFTGHGMGRTPHQMPQIPMHVGRHGRGANPLRTGEILSIVVIAHSGGPRCIVTSDTWNVVTADRSKAVQLTQMVVVGDAAPENLTRERT